MSKFRKIFMILAIFILLFMNIPVLATENTDTNQTETNTSLSAGSNARTQTTTSTANNTNDKSSTQVSSVSSVDDGKLSVSDILNILLIATSVVIILLAIAILIRLNN